MELLNPLDAKFCKYVLDLYESLPFLIKPISFGSRIDHIFLQAQQHDYELKLNPKTQIEICVVVLIWVDLWPDKRVVQKLHTLILDYQQLDVFLPGLEVSRGHIPKHGIIQSLIGDQSFKAHVLTFKLF